MRQYLDTYAWQVPFALGWGTLVYLGLLVPVLLIQYRQYGRLSLRRTLGAGSIAIYGVALAAYTLMPLPAESSHAWCAAYGVQGVLSVPLHSLSEISQATAGLGWRRMLQYPTTMYAALNVLLFIPWGVLLRRYFGLGITAAGLSALSGSLAIEITQYTGLWAVYPCAYRYADVDDLIANTAGALIGAVIAPLLLWWMPHGRDLRESRLEPRPLTVARCWMGMVIDGTIFVGLGAAAAASYRLAGGLLESYGLDRGLAETPVIDTLLAVILPGLVVFVLPALQGFGGSFGERAVWLAPLWAGRQGSWARRLLRACSVGGLATALLAAARLAGEQFPVIGAVSGLACALVVAAAVASVPLSRQRALSGLLTGADLVDARTVSLHHWFRDRDRDRDLLP